MSINPSTFEGAPYLTKSEYIADQKSKPAAVNSVNGKTGAVTLAASDVGALATDGTAASATKLATARTVKFTGAATGSGSFDGSADVSIALTGTAATASAAGVVKAAANMAALTADPTEENFNALLSALKAAGLMVADS